jgi:hypothetical protein
MMASFVGVFRWFVNLLASPKLLRTHSDIASPAPARPSSPLRPNGGTAISVYESIELVATTPTAIPTLTAYFAGNLYGAAARRVADLEKGFQLRSRVALQSRET